MDGRNQSIGEERFHDIARRKNDVPSGISAHHARQHLFIAFVDSVAYAHAELGFKFRDCVGSDVGGPVEDVEARTAIARAAAECAGRQCSEQEVTAVQVVRSLSEIRTSDPNPMTINAEIAFTTGFTPRRAMA